jgi:hypothetical protein
VSGRDLPGGGRLGTGGPGNQIDDTELEARLAEGLQSDLVVPVDASALLFGARQGAVRLRRRRRIAGAGLLVLVAAVPVALTLQNGDFGVLGRSEGPVATMRHADRLVPSSALVHGSDVRGGKLRWTLYDGGDLSRPAQLGTGCLAAALPRTPGARVAVYADREDVAQAGWVLVSMTDVAPSGPASAADVVRSAVAGCGRVIGSSGVFPESDPPDSAFATVAGPAGEWTVVGVVRADRAVSVVEVTVRPSAVADVAARHTAAVVEVHRLLGVAHSRLTRATV